MSSPNNISKKAKQFKRNISPVREIMNYANPDYIRKLGINPEDLISFAGGRGFGRTGINAIRLSFGPLVEDIDKIEEGIEKVAIHLKSE